MIEQNREMMTREEATSLSNVRESRLEKMCQDGLLSSEQCDKYVAQLRVAKTALIVDMRKNEMKRQLAENAEVVIGDDEDGRNIQQPDNGCDSDERVGDARDADGEDVSQDAAEDGGYENLSE